MSLDKIDGIKLADKDSNTLEFLQKALDKGRYNPQMESMLLQHVGKHGPSPETDEILVRIYLAKFKKQKVITRTQAEKASRICSSARGGKGSGGV